MGLIEDIKARLRKQQEKEKRNRKDRAKRQAAKAVALAALPDEEKNPAWAERFLRIFRATGNQSHAAEAVGKSRMAVKRLKDRNPKFKEACDAALDAKLDELEQALIERGKSRSDIAAFFMLKAHRPKYRESAQNLDVQVNQQFNGTAQGPLKFVVHRIGEPEIEESYPFTDADREAPGLITHQDTPPFQPVQNNRPDPVPVEAQVEPIKAPRMSRRERARQAFRAQLDRQHEKETLAGCRRAR